MSVKPPNTLQDFVCESLQKTVASNWRRLRMERGLSGAELANLLGVSARKEYAIEVAAVRTVKMTDVERLAEIYGMDVNALVDELTDSVKPGRFIAGEMSKDARLLDCAAIYPHNVWLAVSGSADQRIDPYEMCACIEELSDRYRIVLEKLYLEGLSVKSVAEEMGVDVSKVNAYRSKALRKLVSRYRRFCLAPLAELHAVKIALKGLGESFDEIENLFQKPGVRWLKFPIDSVDDVELSPVTRNFLKRCRIDTLGELRLCYDDIAVNRHFRDITPKVVAEVTVVLEKRGLL